MPLIAGRTYETDASGPSGLVLAEKLYKVTAILPFRNNPGFAGHHVSMEAEERQNICMAEVCMDLHFMEEMLLVRVSKALCERKCNRLVV